MFACSRLTGFFVVVFSLGFLACALPTTRPTDLSTRDYTADNILTPILGLKSKVEAIVKADVDANIETKLGKIIAAVQATTSTVGASDPDISLDADVKAQIIPAVAAILSAVIKLCVRVDAKSVISVNVIAKLNFCLRLFIDALRAYVEGLDQLLAKLFVGVDAKVLVKIGLTSLVDGMGGLLGEIKLGINL